MKLIGYYNEYGYEITDVDNLNSFENVVYSAGNSPNDSQQEVGLDNNPLSLEAIKVLCKITLKDMAEERKVEIIGVEYQETYGAP